MDLDHPSIHIVLPRTFTGMQNVRNYGSEKHPEIFLKVTGDHLNRKFDDRNWINIQELDKYTGIGSYSVLYYPREERSWRVTPKDYQELYSRVLSESVIS